MANKTPMSGNRRNPGPDTGIITALQDPSSEVSILLSKLGSETGRRLEKILTRSVSFTAGGQPSVRKK